MSALIAILLYSAFSVFVIGCIYRIYSYAKTPVPLKMPGMPAPKTYSGVLIRLLRETVLFESLFKASFWTWLFGWVFHASLLYVLLCHLRFFLDPVWSWVHFITRYSHIAGLLMFGSLCGLMLRRIVIARVRYISVPSDYLMLILLMSLSGSGLLMRFVFYTDLYTLRNFALALTSLSIGVLPGGGMIIIHLLMVSLLLLVFPFSKLVHAIALFFSPSRNQRDTARTERHINKWGS